MLIEVTYSCSMGCSHCMSDCKPNGQHMSVQTFSDSLDFMMKYAIPFWNFSGGEVFEHPDILELLSIIESKWNRKYPITFITNGRKLVQDKTIYNAIANLQSKYGKKNILIQVTDDDRFYPTSLTDKEKYWLRKLNAIIDTDPGNPSDKNKCLYPQGRALENFSEENWYTIAPKCTNVRLMPLQGVDDIHTIVLTLLNNQKICTPVIAPDGSIKLGESALCPPVASIYDTESDIIQKIKNCKCTQCKIPWERLKHHNPMAYNMLTKN